MKKLLTSQSQLWPGPAFVRSAPKPIKQTLIFLNRQITLKANEKSQFINARTDKVIMEAEGYMSISNNSSNELVCTVKIGPDTYRKKLQST